MTTHDLEAIKAAQQPPEGKDERVRRSLEALGQVVNIPLSSKEWKRIAEDESVDD